MDDLTKQYGGLLQESLGAVSQAAKDSGHNPNELKTMLVQATAGKAKCVKKMMPCQEYFKANGSKTVSDTCCEPLRLLVTDEMACLCGVFKNEGFLKSVNITLDNVVKVAKSCDADFDLSECDDISPSPAPAMSDGLTEPTTEGPSVEGPTSESPSVESPSDVSPTLESPPLDIPSIEESSPAPAPAKAANGSGGVRMYNLEKSSLIVLVFTIVFLAFF
ncbi:hypothetical protein M5689_022931 [Euphorbia peplus]|nr:hypothetical protein M5689_022931 [Euphorbia peplus]